MICGMCWLACLPRSVSTFSGQAVPVFGVAEEKIDVVEQLGAFQEAGLPVMRGRGGP